MLKPRNKKKAGFPVTQCRPFRSSGWSVACVDPRADIKNAATVASRFGTGLEMDRPRQLDFIRGNYTPLEGQQYWGALLRRMLVQNLALISGHEDPADSIMIQAVMLRYQKCVRAEMEQSGLEF